MQYRPDGIWHLAANPSPTGQALTQVLNNHVLSAYNLMQAAGDLGVSELLELYRRA